MPDANDDRLNRVAGALEALTGDPHCSVLLAVSGGPDSMALLDLVRRSWAGTVMVATIDHGLRPESRDEAAMVARHCAELGVSHAILRPATAIQGSVQAVARAARYALLEAHAAATAAAFIVTAHHADDQLETMLMRLARGSGVSGLAGIRARNGRIIRPLLGFRKAELVDHCRSAGIPFVDDPSNANPDFDRVRMREALIRFDVVDPAMATRSATALAQAAEALNWIVEREAPTAIVAGKGEVRLVATDYPDAVLRGLVLDCLDRVQPGIMARGPALDRLLASLKRGAQAMIGDVLCLPSDDGRGWCFRSAPARAARSAGE